MRAFSIDSTLLIPFQPRSSLSSSPTLRVVHSRLPSAVQRYRSFTSTTSRNQDVFHAQLDDSKSAAILSSIKKSPPVPQTLTEKIVQKYAVGLPEGKFVKSGDYVTIAPHHCMTHDNTGAVMSKFNSIGASKIKNPRQVVFTLDHDVQNKSEKNLTKYRSIEEFARKHGVDFYPAGRGIGHQIMVEEGYAWPGTMVVASDSHSNMYGGSCHSFPADDPSNFRVRCGSLRYSCRPNRCLRDLDYHTELVANPACLQGDLHWSPTKRRYR